MLKFVKNLKQKLARTKNNFIGKIAETIKLRGKVDEELMEELEEILIQADVGVDLSIDIIDKLREEVRYHKITDVDDVRIRLQNIMSEQFLSDTKAQEESEDKSLSIEEIEQTDISPYVMLFVGVNGVGKTTSIGKLAQRFRKAGKSVMLVAGDTFRAAAIEQLDIWADRAGVDIVKQEQGSDPSSVVYDSLISAKHKNTDIVLIDTAGRQHNKVNLMNELNKIRRTIKKVVPEGPHEVFLVVDATTGQNAVTQAEMFDKAADLTGLILTKLDGTAKGGIVMSIQHKFSIPVKLIGVGEQIDDLRDFNPQEFVEAFFKE